MYEAMEKLLKEGNPKNELISVWNGYIYSDQDDQEWKVQRLGNCQSQRAFLRKGRTATEGARPETSEIPNKD